MGMFREHESGNGALSYSVKRGGDNYKLLEVRLKLSAAAADLDDLKVTIDSEFGVDFDCVVAAPDPALTLTSVTSWRYADVVPPAIFPGDQVVISWPNTGGVTWALEVIGGF